MEIGYSAVIAWGPFSEAEITAARDLSARASRASLSFCSDPGNRCPYRSRAKLTDEWPAREATSFGLAPAAIQRATAVCRRSWGRKWTSPAFLTAGAQKR
jgi:hypothetical protein